MASVRFFLRAGNPEQIFDVPAADRISAHLLPEQGIPETVLFMGAVARSGDFSPGHFPASGLALESRLCLLQTYRQQNGGRARLDASAAGDCSSRLSVCNAGRSNAACLSAPVPKMDPQKKRHGNFPLVADPDSGSVRLFHCDCALRKRCDHDVVLFCRLMDRHRRGRGISVRR